MSSYFHTDKQYQACIEKLSLWIKIKKMDLETRIDHAPACVHFIRKKGTVTAHFRQESQHPDKEGLIYLQGFDITLPTAPSEMWSITKPHKCCIGVCSNNYVFYQHIR